MTSASSPAGVVGGLSSSVIVPVPLAVPSVAPDGLLIVAVKALLPS